MTQFGMKVNAPGSGQILFKNGPFAKNVRLENASPEEAWDYLRSLPVPSKIPLKASIPEEHGGGSIDAKGSHLIFTREADGSPEAHYLSGEGYGLVGHAPAFAPILEKIREAGFTDGRVGIYDVPSKLGGRAGHLRMVALFPERMTFQTGSGPATLGLVAHNSYDGSSSLRIDAGGNVWVCQNQNVWGDAIDGGHVSIRHTEAGIAEAPARFSAWMEDLPALVPELTESFRRVGEIEIPRADVLPFLVAPIKVGGIGLGTDVARSIAENLPSLLIGEAQQAMLSPATITAEGLMNAGTRYFTHHAEGDADTGETGLVSFARILRDAKERGSDYHAEASEAGRAKLKVKIAPLIR